MLAQYVGWGGLADAFDPNKDNWAKEYTELKGMLSEDEYAAARGSVLNAHYTSPTVIRAIYDAVEKWDSVAAIFWNPAWVSATFRDAAGHHAGQPPVWCGTGQHHRTHCAKAVPAS